MAQGKHSLQQHDRILNEGEKLTKLSNSQDRVRSDVIGLRNKIIIQEKAGFCTNAKAYESKLGPDIHW